MPVHQGKKLDRLLKISAALAWTTMKYFTMNYFYCKRKEYFLSMQEALQDK